MEATVYLLCSITAVLVTIFLWRGYRRSRSRLLLHAGSCFAWLVLSNALLFVDRILLPGMDLALWPTVAAIIGMTTLLVAMVLQGDEA
jgi:hypothetical protein